MIHSPNKQRGFLMIAAIALIVFFAVLAAVFSKLILRQSVTASYLLANKFSPALADSGLALGENTLTQATLANRSSCSGLNETETLDNNSYQAVAASGLTNPKRVYSTLQSTNVSSSISLSDSSLFASSGFVWIGNELFSYTAKDDSNDELLNVQRALDNTYASDYEKGSVVSQHQCTISGLGKVPASSPKAVSELQQPILLDYAFTVGDSGVLLSFNETSSELNWSSTSFSGNPNLLSIDALNSHQAIATTTEEGNKFRLYLLEGTSWSKVTIKSKSNEVSQLNDVSFINPDEAWVVGGSNSKKEFTILRGSNLAGNGSWRRFTSNKKCKNFTVDKDIDAEDKPLLTIKMLDPPGSGQTKNFFGFAAGGKESEGVMLKLASSGSKVCFQADSLPSSVGQVQQVTFVRNGSSAPSLAYAVAINANNTNQGQILLWQSGSWAVWVSASNKLYGISMIDTNNDGVADYGWAVGAGGIAYRYQSGSWSQQANIGSQTLTSVSLVSATDGWAVGDNGARYHFNGTNWQAYQNGISTSVTLNKVKLIAAQTIKSGPISQALN